MVVVAIEEVGDGSAGLELAAGRVGTMGSPWSGEREREMSVEN